MDCLNQPKKSNQYLPNAKSASASSQSDKEITGDAFMDFEKILRDFPLPDIEEALALLPDNPQSDVEFDLNELVGLSAKDEEHNNVTSHSVASTFDLSLEDLDLVSRGSTQSQTLSSQSSTPDPGKSAYRPHEDRELTPMQPGMRVVSVANTSSVAQGSLTSGATQRNRAEQPTYRRLAVANTYFDALGTSGSPQVPIARSLRTRPGASTLPFVSGSLERELHRPTDLHAPFIHFPQRTNPWVAAQPQTTSAYRGSAALRHSQAEVPFHARRTSTIDPSQLPSWASWVGHDQGSLNSFTPSSPLPSMSSVQDEVRRPSSYRVDVSRGNAAMRSAPGPEYTAPAATGPGVFRVPSFPPSGKEQLPKVPGRCPTEATPAIGKERGHSKCGQRPTPAADTVQGSQKEEAHQLDRLSGPKAKGEQQGPLHRAHTSKNAQAPTFVSDRLGDIGLCKFTKVDGDGVSGRICNAKIPDDADKARDHLYRHFREHNLYDLGPAAKVWCPWCKVKKTQLGGFSRHIIDVHLKINMALCPCGGSTSRGQQHHGIRRHVECGTHLLWVDDMERQLEEKLGLVEVCVARDEEFIEYQKQWDDGSMNGSSVVTRRRRRHSV